MDLLESSSFAQRLEKTMEAWHVPGMAIAVVHDEKFASRAFGLASLEDKIAMTPETLSNIASCSKSFTAGLLGIAIAEKDSPDFRWDSTVSSLLPGEFVLSDDMYTENINIDDVVSHRTGFSDCDRSLFGPRSSHPDTPKTITNNLRNFPINTPLRTTFQYNNLMYNVAAYLHERQTGLSWSDGLRDKIFQPLGMNSSFVHIGAVPSQLRPKAAVGYGWLKGKGYHPLEAIDQPEGEGAGCIITSVEDHIKWVHALIQQIGPITPEIRKELLRPRSIDDLWDNTKYPYTSKDLYAAGWWIRYYRGHEIAFHSGCDVGFGSFTFFVPSLKFGGVVHGNSEEASDLSPAIGLGFIDAALGIPEDERPDWVALFKGEDSEDESEKDKDAQASEPQTRPLDAYVGTYWHPGFKNMKVEIKDGQLFIDATNRCYPIELTFEHVSGQTDYRVILKAADLGTTETLEAKFEIEGEKTIRMGLPLIDDSPLSWFEKARE